MKGFYWLLILLLLSVGQIESVQAAPASPSGAEPRFPKPMEEYHDEQIPGIAAKLVQRIQAEPFNLVGTLIFLGAIIHTFLASKFMLIAHRLEHQYHALREGARVAIADVNLQGAEAVAHEIQSRKEAALPVQMDVSSEKSVESAFESVIREFGAIDILLSNAGIQIIHPIVDFPFADWQKVIAIHLDGAFLTTRAAMRSMIASGRGGCILYMGSAHSFIAALNKSAYVAAKHALAGLTRSVAKEGAKHRIRANMIAPGFVRTALVEKQIPEQAQQLGITEEEVVKNVMLRATVDGEFTSVLDLAETAVFLAAFPSLALTGQSINVSHGHFMH